MNLLVLPGHHIAGAEFTEICECNTYVHFHPVMQYYNMLYVFMILL